MVIVCVSCPFGESHRPGQRRAGGEVARVGGAEADRIVDAGFGRETAGAVQGEGEQGGAAVAFHHLRIVEPDLALIGAGQEALADVGAAGGARLAMRPREIGVGGAGAGQLQRRAGVACCSKRPMSVLVMPAAGPVVAVIVPS